MHELLAAYSEITVFFAPAVPYRHSHMNDDGIQSR